MILDTAETMEGVNETEKCKRCHEEFGHGPRCQECGIGKHRIVRKKRNRNIGGKRGRNSGKVSSGNKKKG